MLVELTYFNYEVYFSDYRLWLLSFQQVLNKIRVSFQRNIGNRSSTETHTKTMKNDITHKMI